MLRHSLPHSQIQLPNPASIAADSSRMKSYAIEGAAMLKILLHAAKHPTSAVNGVLLGTVSPAAGGAAAAGASPPTSPRVLGAAAAVQVTDAVPIGHTFITLAPVLEAALCQVGG